MGSNRFQSAEIPFDESSFPRHLLHELTDVLQEIIGHQETRGFIAVVGVRVGDAFNAAYRRAVGACSLKRPEVAEAIVDLQRRIGGDFDVIDQNDEEIVLGNRRCPFGDAVRGRPALCMMTSNVFGRIAAENFGYAKVSIEESFATGEGRCLVRVMLENSKLLEKQSGREYFRVGGEVGESEKEGQLGS
jgi:predicted ArsR family transcriptional regulator